MNEQASKHTRDHRVRCTNRRKPHKACTTTRTASGLQSNLFFPVTAYTLHRSDTFDLSVSSSQPDEVTRPQCDRQLSGNGDRSRVYVRVKPGLLATGKPLSGLRTCSGEIHSHLRVGALAWYRCGRSRTALTSSMFPNMTMLIQMMYGAGRYLFYDSFSPPRLELSLYTVRRGITRMLSSGCVSDQIFRRAGTNSPQDFLPRQPYFTCVSIRNWRYGQTDMGHGPRLQGSRTSRIPINSTQR